MNILWLIGLDLNVPWWWIILTVFGAYIIKSIRPWWTLKRQGLYVRGYPIFGSFVEIGKHGMYAFEIGGLTLPRLYGEIFDAGCTLVTKDVELIKEVLIKDFGNFTNRIVNKPGQMVFPFNAFLVNIEDADWKRVRNIITPTFSAGKLKVMATQMNEIAGELTEKLQKICDKDEYFNAKEVSGALTMDVIARTTFGLQVDTFKEPNNQFVKYADQIMTPNFKNPALWISFWAPFLVPYFKYVGLSIMPPEAINFFVEVTKATVSRRHEHKEGDKTLMQLMADAHKEVDGENTGKGLTENEVLAQGLQFFISGYDTVRHVMSFMLFNMATNPKEQEKVFEEIQKKIGEKSLITYDDIHSLTYLDMCLSENLRIFPAASRTNRRCNEARTYNGVHIPKNMGVTIPILALHFDPEVWPEPKEFRPERFTPEEKAKRSPYMYAPFGHGPRNCVAMRLALMEIKLVVVTFIRKFRIVTGPDTEIPPKLTKIRTTAESDMKLKLQPRE